MKRIMIIILVFILLGGVAISITKPFEYINKIKKDDTVHIDGTDNIWRFEQPLNPSDANMSITGFKSYSVKDGKLNLTSTDFSKSAFIHFGNDFDYQLSDINKVKLSFDIVVSADYLLDFDITAYCTNFEDISQDVAGLNFNAGTVNIPGDSIFLDDVSTDESNYSLHIDYEFDKSGLFIARFNGKTFEYEGFVDGEQIAFNGFNLYISPCMEEVVDVTIDNVIIDIS